MTQSVGDRCDVSYPGRLEGAPGPSGWWSVAHDMTAAEIAQAARFGYLGLSVYAGPAADPPGHARDPR